ncbi:MAG: adenylate/guanylate cyclase domain-containing protein [Thermodesulfobacteriota bacterium]
MSHDCPATRMFIQMRDSFRERIAKIKEQPKKDCVFKNLKDTPFCPVNYFKGKIAEKTLKKVEKDKDLSGDLRRGVVKDLAIMFADIRGFTTRTAEMPPDRIVTLLDLFVPEMFNIIINRHGGTVDKLLGDGIMAIYGHPYQTGQEVVKAIHSAIDMQQAAAALEQVLTIAGYDPVEIGVGINYGKVLICEVGDDRYRESTVIGAPVNLAAKMEDVAKASEIVLPKPSLAAVEQIRPKMIPYFEERGMKSGVSAMSFNWVHYIQNEPAEFKEWKIE